MKKLKTIGMNAYQMILNPVKTIKEITTFNYIDALIYVNTFVALNVLFLLQMNINFHTSFGLRVILKILEILSLPAVPSIQNTTIIMIAIIVPYLFYIIVVLLTALACFINKTKLSLSAILGRASVIYVPLSVATIFAMLLNLTSLYALGYAMVVVMNGVALFLALLVIKYASKISARTLLYVVAGIVIVLLALVFDMLFTQVDMTLVKANQFLDNWFMQVLIKFIKGMIGQ